MDQNVAISELSFSSAIGFRYFEHSRLSVNSANLVMFLVSGSNSLAKF